MDLKEIQTLIKFISSSGVDEVAIEKKDFKINIHIFVIFFTCFVQIPRAFLKNVNFFEKMSDLLSGLRPQ